MGIFDKKAKGKKEDFDSPVERIDLSATETPSEAPDAAESEAAPAPEAEQPAPVAKKEPDEVEQDYGIEEAIALMRTLPMESVELVVRVVKQTLESTRIHIPTIIKDATAKEERINSRIAVLKEEITDLEKEIAERTEEIGTLEADHEETSMVKERLELAENLGKSEAKESASAGAKMPPPKGGKKAAAAAANKK